MFSSVSNLVRSRLGRRIYLSILSIIVFSMGTLLVTIYYLMSHALEKKDQELILSKSNELQVRYERDGISGLRVIDPWVFLRLESPQGATLLIRRSKDDDNFDLSKIEEFSKSQIKSDGWVSIPAKDDEEQLVIHSERLKDGALLQVGKNTAERENNLELLLSLFLGVSVPLLLITLFLGAYVSKRVTGSIQLFIQTLNQIRSGELSSRMPIDQNEDEIGQLAHLFNQMLEKIEFLILGMRETVDDIAHDLRTPVTRFKGLAEAALKHPENSAQMKNALEEALESAEQMMELLSLVMDISEAEAGALKLQFENVRLDEVLVKVSDLYRDVAEEKNVSIHLELTRVGPVKADLAQIKRAFANLLDNAIKYTAVGGVVTIGVHESNGQVNVVIQDTGIGIDEKDISLIWNRHFRGDRSRSEKGLGLGLSLVRAIVRAHSGSVSVESHVGVGSVFTVSLPITSL